MSEQLFSQSSIEDENVVPAPGYPGVFKEANRDTYKKGRHGNTAVVIVPEASPLGGIPGKPLTYGIKLGRQFQIDVEEGATIDKGTVPFSFPGDAPAPIQTVKESVSVKKNVKNKRGKALQEILEQDTVEPITESVQQVPVQSAKSIPIPEPEIELTKATLQGKFGKFNGQYLDIINEEGKIVLVQETESSTFVPPSSDEDSLYISWVSSTGDVEKQEVYYLGLSFECSKLGYTFHIFHKAVEA